MAAAVAFASETYSVLLTICGLVGPYRRACPSGIVWDAGSGGPGNAGKSRQGGGRGIG